MQKDVYIDLSYILRLPVTHVSYQLPRSVISKYFNDGHKMCDIVCERLLLD